MWSTQPNIAAGDVVIIWMTRDAITSLVVTPTQTWNSKFGTYPHTSFIGLPYGSKVTSRTGKGFVHVLRPTPELWTLALPHRTQILYAADIAFIVGWLDIGVGCKVIEAGTGSGSFSHSMARSIAPTGMLWSYEFHEVRAAKAREEFKTHGLDQLITLTHRNVVKDGFTIEDTADCVFLDLPAPWLVIDHAKKALRKDRITRICCFSPCMEQVLRTVSTLNSAGFTDITMYETLTRPHDVFQPGTCLSVSTTISQVGEKLKQAEIRREEKRIRQVAASRAGHLLKEGKDTESHHGITAVGKRKRVVEGADGGEGADEGGDGVGDDVEEVETKRVRTEEGGKTASLTATPQNQNTSSNARPMVVSRPLTEIRGHTSYLTFACLVPRHPKAEAESDPQGDSSNAITPAAEAMDVGSS